ncbi:conserved hypothetical protein [Oleispira antarctica RB-8]|uniref:Protein NO VEIN C-terminal domain-containing protein n=1 Tax=Oleispira antarctica RB-8 TaxID=698738 RepID=R4YNR1_OLEAN|nr:conserved hypothetical protein [Oleispira antarctica RB-8]
MNSFMNAVQMSKQENIDIYETSHNRITADFRMEKSTTESYNGRQILELLQNCDDALLNAISSEKRIVDIKIDTKNNLLSISNFGEAFSAEGVSSLLLANSSNKGREFIGNKGLGFRSILNWAKKVTINSHDCKIHFSKSIIKEYFEKIVSSQNEREALIHKDKDKLSRDEVPMAVLSMPKIEEDPDHEYTTTITIEYNKTVEGDIKEQLSALNTKLLVFLNHIRTINIHYESEGRIETIQTLSDESDLNHIVTNDGTWNIASSGHVLFDEQENDDRYFEVKLAWQDELSDEDASFYTYFPTAVRSHLPLLIHGTFELDSTRNSLNTSINGENQRVLKYTANFLKETALNRIAHKECNWDALRILSAKSVNTTPVLEEFYSLLEQSKNTEKLYPCIDGQYVAKDDAIYHGKALSHWVLENGLGVYFPNLIKAPEAMELGELKKYSFENWMTMINDVNDKLTVQLRVELIKIITTGGENCFKEIYSSESHLPLLLDNSNQVVKAEVQVFTKAMTEFNGILPSYIDDIAFISSELYECLKTSLHEEINTKRLDSESGDSRALKRLLANIVNIGSDDITDVIKLIVSETRSYLSYEGADQIEAVKDMVQSLFSLFKSNPDRRGTLGSIDKIPLISRSNKIVIAENLLLGREYDKGNVTETIFQGIKDDDEFLACNDTWGLTLDDVSIIDFFTWLNVGYFPRVTEKKGEFDRWNEDSYIKFVLDSVKAPKSNCYKSYTVAAIVGLESLLVHESFSLEKLLLWISQDLNFKKQLSDENRDIFKTKFNGSDTIFSKKPSYLSFLIHNSGITDNVLASLPVKGLTSIKCIDRDSELFSLHSIEDWQIDEVLSLLEIKNSFNDLEPKLVYTFLSNMNNVQISQEFYKLCYKYFRANEDGQLKAYKPNFNGLKYWARKGGIEQKFELIDASEVYYSDNKLLPQAILNDYWIINLPKRIGEDNVKKFFGVNLIKDDIKSISIIDEEKNSLDAELNKYINSLKPYLLCYRLENLKKLDGAQTDAGLFKTFQIKLVLKASVEIATKIIELKNCDFFPSSSNTSEFVLKHTTDFSLEKLKGDSYFCDAIAEIICVLLKVGDLKNTFRRIFKDGIIESEHIIRSDDLYESLNQAKKLLGISLEEQHFWQKVFPDTMIKNLNDSKDFIRVIQGELGRPLPSFYSTIDFNNLANEAGVKLLKWLADIDAVELKELLNSEGLKAWHKIRLGDVIRDYSKQFESFLWKQANDSKDISLKEHFFEKSIAFDDSVGNGCFENFIDENKYNLEANYLKAVQFYVQGSYGLALNSDICIIEVHAKYESLLSEYQFADDIEGLKNDLKAVNKSVHSLLYFEGFEDIIKKALDKLENTHKQGFSDDNNDVSDIEGLKIVHTGMLQTPGRSSNATESKGSYSHSSQKDKKKAKAGKREELKVVKALESDGYEVRHIAKKRDAKHYDLEYKKSGESDWRFLEVKKDSGGFFFLSKPEKDTAMKVENIDRYDIAIVDGKTINIIEKPFYFGDETFENNSKFTATATDFVINFKLEEES